MSRKLLILLPAVMGMLLSSCGSEEPAAPIVIPPAEDKEFSGVAFNDASHVYDGNSYILDEVIGAPEGTSVTYTGRNLYSEVGRYEATALLEKEGYKSLTLYAYLTILPATITDISYSDIAVTYDGEDHINDIIRNGNLPIGVNESKEVKDENGNVVTSAINSGTYSYTFTLSGSNYNTKTLTATLTINKKEFPRLVLDNTTITYDGKDHIGEAQVTGDIPEGTNIEYRYVGDGDVTVTSIINAGSYGVYATISKENYVTRTLSAYFLVQKATFSGLSVSSAIVDYDGNDHINEVTLVGFLPDNTTVTKEVKKGGVTVTSAIEAGTYDYTFTVKNSNYVNKTLTGTLTIEVAKENMEVFYGVDGKVYFANGMHNKYLYSYDSSDSSIKLVDYSTPDRFFKNSDNTFGYVDKGVFTSSAKEINGSDINTLFTDGGLSSFVKADASTYYYSKNSLTASKSGIYKVEIVDENEEPVVTKIYEGKTNNLVLNDNDLYFINKSESKNIYKLDLTTLESSLVLDAKTDRFVISSGYLYYSASISLVNQVGSLKLSDGTTKQLFNGYGEYLQLYGSNVYFYYSDPKSTDLEFNRSDIYYITASTSKFQGATDSKCNDIRGFAVNGNYFYYVDGSNGHLILHKNTINPSNTDLLDGFVAPETTPMNTGGRSILAGDKVYFLNMYANKALYSVVETSERKAQLTSNKVEDFYIYNGKLYFNQVTRLANNDVYVVDLNMGGVAEKINSNDVRDMVSDGTYLYGVHHNWAGLSAGISRMKLDGSEYVKFSEVNGAKNITVREDKLYYINASTGQDNGNIEYVSLSSITETASELEGTNLSSNIKNVKQFAFDGDNIFYIYNGLVENSIRRTDFTSLGEGTKIASTDTNPNEFVLSGDYVYYYSYPSSKPSAAGFYKVSKTATSDGTQTLVGGYSSKYYGSALAVSSKNIYFLNYIPKLTLGDAHFYKLSLSISGLYTKII